jgi:thiamine-monophosphate kinase
MALLTGGDDYQTLFTAPPSARDAISASGQGVTRIGQAEQGVGVKVLDAAGTEMPVVRGGWKHMGPDEKA